MYSWNCYVLLSSGSWCFHPLTARVWQSRGRALRNTRNNLSLAYSCCAPSREWPFPAAHWNGTGDLPAAAPRQRERLKQLPHRWCQVRSASLLRIPRAYRIPRGKAEHGRLALASFPEEPGWPCCLQVCSWELPSPSVTHWAGENTPGREAQGSQGEISLEIPWKQARQGQRWHVSAPSSAGTLAKCLARALSLLDTGESTRERGGDTWDIPPNQHKKSVHREQEHWHCLNKHTHHEVLRGVRGFLDILIL